MLRTIPQWHPADLCAHTFHSCPDIEGFFFKKMKWMQKNDNSSINLTTYNGCWDALWEPASGGLQTGVSQSQSRSGNCPEWDAALKLGPSLCPCTCFYHYMIFFVCAEDTERNSRLISPTDAAWGTAASTHLASCPNQLPGSSTASSSKRYASSRRWFVPSHTFESPLSSLPSPCVYNAFLKTRLRTGWSMTGVLISSPLWYAAQGWETRWELWFEMNTSRVLEVRICLFPPVSQRQIPLIGISYLWRLADAELTAQAQRRLCAADSRLRVLPKCLEWIMTTNYTGDTIICAKKQLQDL